MTTGILRARTSNDSWEPMNYEKAIPQQTPKYSMNGSRNGSRIGQNKCESIMHFVIPSRRFRRSSGASWERSCFFTVCLGGFGLQKPPKTLRCFKVPWSVWWRSWAYLSPFSGWSGPTPRNNFKSCPFLYKKRPQLSKRRTLTERFGFRWGHSCLGPFVRTLCQGEFV